MPSLLPTPALYWRAAVAVPEERERESKQTEILQRVFPDTPLSIIAE